MVRGVANLAFKPTMELTNGQTDRRANKTRVGGFMSTLFMMTFPLFFCWLRRETLAEKFNLKYCEYSDLTRWTLGVTELSCPHR